MKDFILLMHDDALSQGNDADWDRYFNRLHQSGAFDGGSSLGEGACYRKSGTPGPKSRHLTGFIRVRAADLAAATAFLAGNPVYENQGTIEIREMPRD